MNKIGILWLGEETLKIVIAVISIGLLVYLLVSLYLSMEASRDLELAKESLNFLVSEINSGKDKVDIYNPNGWQLGIWPHEVHITVRSGTAYVKTETDPPKTCSNLGWASCICICKENKADSCDDNGICLNNIQNFTIIGDSGVEGSIEIKDPPITLNIDQTNKGISKAGSQGRGLGGGWR